MFFFVIFSLRDTYIQYTFYVLTFVYILSFNRTFYFIKMNMNLMLCLFWCYWSQNNWTKYFTFTYIKLLIVIGWEKIFERNWRAKKTQFNLIKLAFNQSNWLRIFPDQERDLFMLRFINYKKWNSKIFFN